MKPYLLIYNKMKFSKKILWVFAISVLVFSCQTRVVSPAKPLYDNNLDLYKKYTVQTKDAKIYKVEVVKIDATKIYGKTKTGEMIEIEKSEVREIRKPNILASIIIGLAAMAAVVFIPI